MNIIVIYLKESPYHINNKILIKVGIDLCGGEFG